MTDKTAPLTFHWFLPSNGGDSRQVVGGGHGEKADNRVVSRPADVGYLGQIARSAEQLGFVSALTPTGAWCEDAWMTTAMLTQVTEQFKYLVAFRPGVVSPTLAAQQATTFQNLSHGRLLLNVVVGGESHEMRQYGVFGDKAERYQTAEEFLDIVRALWSGEKVTYQGTHLQVEEAQLPSVPTQIPEIYFGGSSPEAGRVAARHADVYLTWGEPPEAVKEKLEWINSLAAEQGRTIKHGIRLHVISRDTSEEAWAEADRLLEGVDDAMIARMQANFARSESEGQRRMVALNQGSRDDLEVYPNLWAGVGLVRGGAGTAMVGSHEEVAALVEKYHEVGITEFVLSGYPHLESAYHFGEGVLPLLAERGLWQHPGRRQVATAAAVPFGGGSESAGSAGAAPAAPAKVAAS